MHEALRNLNTEKQATMDGSPAVMRDEAGFINVKFQHGPVGKYGVNGTSIENVLDLLIDRLVGFQAGNFRCEENARAISYLEAAINVLEERTQKRVEQGVEGTYQSHQR